MVQEWESKRPDPEEVENLRRRLGAPDHRQVAIWRTMTGARCLELVGQAYHLVLETIRASERSLDPDVSPEELKRRVIHRIHGDVLPREAYE